MPRYRQSQFYFVSALAIAAAAACSAACASDGSAANRSSAAGGQSAAGGWSSGAAGPIVFGGSVSGGACSNAADCDIGCGNGTVEPALGETCDDGNHLPADGCSADCKSVDTNYACLEPGSPCVNLVSCGDGAVRGNETCDDGNQKSGDGCSAECKLEVNWICAAPFTPCAPRCGDGVLIGEEQCDAPNPGQGCSAACRLEPGYVCDPPPRSAGVLPAACRSTRCGDGVKEGAEACDDANTIDGDGCSGACSLEPTCTSDGCSSKCGDGLRLAGEGCDDGNTRDADGCSHACELEPGYTCRDSMSSAPKQLNLAVTYRDFLSFPIAPAERHPDFEADLAGDAETPLLVTTTLGADGKPVMDGRCSEEKPETLEDPTQCPYGQMLTTVANFGQWYRDTPGVNVTIPSALLLPQNADGAYVYDSARSGFYPIDGQGFTRTPATEDFAQADAVVNDGLLHDYGFTTEIHFFFQYWGGEALAFSGDDDLWIFVNGRLALDLGGLHTRTQRELELDASAADLALTRGGIYEIALFHAERHSAGSNFKLTLTGFRPTVSACLPTCGDAVVVPPEHCDLGASNDDGAYAGCSTRCQRTAHCGDGTVQSEHEQCDDGANLTTYALDGRPRCAPTCVLSGYCGDGKLDGSFGEQCDLGADENDGDYAGCTSLCQLAPRCGDGVLQPQSGEVCDDGNARGGDGCSYDCKSDIR